MLTLTDVTYSYSKRQLPVIRNYSLEVLPGTICGLLGKNGAGKSTLLYLIAGLLKPKSGSADYNGFTPWKRDTNFLNDVFIVPEEFILPNVPLMDFVKTTSPFYPRFSMDALLSHLATFEMDEHTHLGQLSMGQKKRVFISFALACNTSLLLLDEPTNGLDIPGKRLFRKAVLNSMNDRRTIIISTHQVYDVEKIIDHVVITDRNGVLLDKSVYEISSRLRFLFTTDRQRAANALIALDAPGGYNIIEPSSELTDETDINLESLFEFVCGNPAKTNNIFNANI